MPRCSVMASLTVPQRSRARNSTSTLSGRAEHYRSKLVSYHKRFGSFLGYQERGAAEESCLGVRSALSQPCLPPSSLRVGGIERRTPRHQRLGAAPNHPSRRVGERRGTAQRCQAARGPGHGLVAALLPCRCLPARLRVWQRGSHGMAHCMAPGGCVPARFVVGSLPLARCAALPRRRPEVGVEGVCEAVREAVRGARQEAADPAAGLAQAFALSLHTT